MMSIINNTFNTFAEDWWQYNGRMAILHAMHPARMEFIIKQLSAIPTTSSPLRALDIGCGGGITTESLALLGMRVTGFDIASDLLESARRHAVLRKLDIDYHHIDFSKYNDDSKRKNFINFDLVCILEVIEHVADPITFLRNAKDCLRPGGILIISTINRTLKSLFLAISLAEYVLHLLPKKTHDWQRFIKPSEIIAALPDTQVLAISGILPTTGLYEWSLVTSRLAVNYIISIQTKY